jgi:hypothetical protein
MYIKTKKTKSESLQDIMNQYLKATKAIKMDMNEVAAWAVRNGLYEASHKDTTKQCAHELARAARDEYYTDPQGRRVRKKHATRQTIDDEGEQKPLVLWADMYRPGFFGHWFVDNHAAISTPTQASFRAWAGVR